MTGALSLRGQIDCVRRELRQRQQVYARLVASGRMKSAAADYEIASMERVLRTLQWVERHEPILRQAVADMPSTRGGGTPGPSPGRPGGSAEAGDGDGAPHPSAMTSSGVSS